MSDPKADEFRDGFPFLAGRLWLDFLNTAPATLGELIAQPEDLARWARAAELDGDGRYGPAEVQAAHQLRAALGGVFRALSDDAPPPAEAIERINHHLAGARRTRQIASIGDRLEIAETLSADLFGRIASDLADFIADFEPGRMRACAGADCSLVFYDTARNATRRWCSMAACSNRHKVTRHRARGAGE